MIIIADTSPKGKVISALSIAPFHRFVSALVEWMPEIGRSVHSLLPFASRMHQIEFLMSSKDECKGYLRFPFLFSRPWNLIFSGVPSNGN